MVAGLFRGCHGIARRNVDCALLAEAACATDVVVVVVHAGLGNVASLCRVARLVAYISCSRGPLAGASENGLSDLSKDGAARQFSSDQVRTTNPHGNEIQRSPLSLEASTRGVAGNRTSEKRPTDDTFVRTIRDVDRVAVSQLILAIGTATVFVWLLVGQARAWLLCRRSKNAPEHVCAELRAVLKSGGHCPQLLVNVSLAAPIATGVWRPTILLPIDLVAQSAVAKDEDRGSNVPALRALLAHELAHIEHGDLWLLAVGRLLFVLLFANPLYWLLWRRIRADQELLADAAAAEVCDRHAYAEALVAWARHQRQPASRLVWALGVWERPSQLSRRIAMLLDERFRLRTTCSRGWQISSGSAAAVLAAALSLFTLNPRSQVKRRIGGCGRENGRTPCRENESFGKP